MSEFPTPEMELTCHLVVSNVAASVSWYRDVLGAELIREYGGTSAVFRLLGQWLLITSGGPPTADKPGVTFAPPDPDKASSQLIFRVPDAQAAYHTLSARGAVFIAPPVHYDHGETRAFFRDPDNHLFEISALDS
jgi:catechol 2,3-dioxygenase-like lactoylglutathione lyase family enzyme